MQTVVLNRCHHVGFQQLDRGAIPDHRGWWQREDPEPGYSVVHVQPLPVLRSNHRGREAITDERNVNHISSIAEQNSE